MSHIFDDREKQFEAKYKHDEELRFKVHVRRDKLLGLWAAAELGLKGAEAEAYAKSLVNADLEKLGHGDLVEKSSPTSARARSRCRPTESAGRWRPASKWRAGR